MKTATRTPGGRSVAKTPCACGCGLHPVSGRYLRGHSRKLLGGKSWNGGYPTTRVLGHHRADQRGYVRDHILVAERALGHALPPKSEVHHVDEDKANSAKENLVVCQDHAYHSLLHQRQRALDECGDASKLRCGLCCSYDRQGDMARFIGRHGTVCARHRSCNAASARARYRRSIEAEDEAKSGVGLLCTARLRVDYREGSR